MMKKKIGISLLFALLLSAFVIGAVIAGSSLDFGLVETQPPVGEVNWTAWFTNTANTLTEGMPNEVMTEDGTNCDLGVDQGYQTSGSGPAWYAQIDLLVIGKAHDEPVSMIFGGIGASSGKLWFYGFNWNEIFEPVTVHGTVPLSTQSEACPEITAMSYEGSTKNVTFSGLPSSTYLVYRSRNGSGAGNQASNGRYLYLLTTTTNTSGIGTFTDISELPSWYIVIRADGDNSLAGCHSEEANPTNVRMVDFTATYHPHNRSVEVAWETASEFDILGFNVLRSTSESGDQMPLNEKLIDAKPPGGIGGNTYIYDDFEIVLGETYYYWIEIEGLDINRESVGPQSVRTLYTFYMPFVQ